MQASILQRDNTLVLRLIGALAVIGLIWFAAERAAGGTKTGIALAAIIALSPIALYAAIKRPFVFPFAFYALLTPFNDIFSSPTLGTLNRLLGMLSALALAFMLIRRKQILKPPKALLGWTIIVVWAAASMVWSIEPNAEAWSLVFTLSQLFLLYALLSIAPIEKADFNVVLFGTAVGGVLAAAYGIYQFHSLQHETDRLFLKAGQSYFDPNQFSAGLILPIAILLYAYCHTRRSFQKLGLLVCLGVTVSGVFVSGSRGCLLALVALYAYWFIKGRNRRQLLALAAVMVLLSLAFSNTLWPRLSSALATGGAGRVDIWRLGFEAFKRHWLVGAGIDQFSNATYEVYLRVVGPPGQWRAGSHNLIEGIGVELGILGLIAVLLTWRAQFGMLRQIVRPHPLYDLRVSLEATVLALFVDAMFLDIMYRKYTWLAFGLVALTRAFSLAYPLGAVEQNPGQTQLAPLPTLRSASSNGKRQPLEVG